MWRAVRAGFMVRAQRAIQGSGGRSSTTLVAVEAIFLPLYALLLILSAICAFTWVSRNIRKAKTSSDIYWVASVAFTAT